MEMFDLTKEKPISLHEAADLLPPTKRGKKVSVVTITRWIIDGALQGGKFGRAFCTSAEAMARYLARNAEGGQSRTPRKGTPAKPGTNRRARRADARLAAKGFKVGGNRRKTAAK